MHQEKLSSSPLLARLGAMATPSLVFQQRRQRLAKAMAENGVERAAFCSGWARPRNFAHNVFPFRAESHFLYLVGRHLEGAVLRLDEGSACLFVTAPAAEAALWSGPAPTLDELSRMLQIEVRPIEEDLALSETACLPPQDEESAIWFGSLLNRDVEAQSGPELTGLDAALAAAMVSVRLVHDSAALSELKAAAEVSAQAHRAGMRGTHGAQFEYSVRGTMEGSITSAGMGLAYRSIVSVHGDVLHHDSSRNPLNAGELLLCDVGAETEEGWAGDVTRTWPTSGRFSATQKEIYELVLEIQKTAIASVRPGVRFLDLHRSAGRQMAEGLVALGILRGAPDDLYERGAASIFFPHGLGHLLGLDVHDMEDLGDLAGYDRGKTRSTLPGESALRLDRVLAAAQVVTIEPGFYQSPVLLERARRDAALSETVNWSTLSRFRDVRGIRIEDDVQVTARGADVLSSAAPKEIADIEALMGTGRLG